MKKLTLFLALCTLAHAVGTVQQSIQQLGTTNNWVLTFNWTGDAANGSVPNTAGLGLSCCLGYFALQVETTPGSPAPTNGYSVQIQDPSGADILAGAASTVSSTVSQSFAVAASAPPIQGTLTLVISGQNVASAKGIVSVFLSKPGSINLATIGKGGNGTLGKMATSAGTSVTFSAAIANTFSVGPLTQNVTSSILQNPLVGQTYLFLVTQGTAGQWTFAWPSNFDAACPIDPSTSSVTVLAGEYDGTNLRVNLCRYVQQTQASSYVACRGSVAAQPNLLGLWCDSVLKGYFAVDPTGNVYGMPAMQTNSRLDSLSQPITLNPTGFAIPTAVGGGGSCALLAKLTTDVPTKLTTALTTDTSGIVGIFATGIGLGGGGCGIVGIAYVVSSGVAVCTVDGAVTAGDYVIISNVTAGNCKDGGASLPATNEVIGRFLDSCAINTSCAVLVQLERE